jgi:hypothetical protein
MACCRKDEDTRVREGGEEPGGGWVEDLNGLLGFNKGFQGRYIDVDHHHHHHEE